MKFPLLARARIKIKGHTHLITQTVDQLTKQVDAIRTHEKQQVVALMENDLSQRNLKFAILLLCSFTGVGTFFFSLGEGWDALVGFYFSFITVTTIGYGDYSPQTNNMRYFLVLYCMFGASPTRHGISHTTTPRVQRSRPPPP